MSKLHEHKGFTLSEKLCLNLFSLRKFRPSINLVRRFKPMELKILYVGLVLDLPSFSKDILRNDQDSNHLIITSSLSTPLWLMENNVCSAIKCCGIISFSSVVLVIVPWYYMKQISW